MDLQAGGVSQFSVYPSGFFTSRGGADLATSSGNLAIKNNAAILYFGSSYDLALTYKGAAKLQLGLPDSASATPQTLSVQSVVAGQTNVAGAAFTINGSQGTGTGAGGSIIFQVAPAGGSGSAQNALATALTIDSTKLATFTGGINLTAGNYTLGAGAGLVFSTRGTIYSTADGIISLFNNSLSDFNRLQFGGVTSSFPSLKRSTTFLQARLADDSAFTNIQGKLTTDTAYTAGALVATGYITIYDSTGTAYRVPCLV
jgi:hypothetical protein